MIHIENLKLRLMQLTDNRKFVSQQLMKCRDNLTLAKSSVVKWNAVNDANCGFFKYKLSKFLYRIVNGNLTAVNSRVEQLLSNEACLIEKIDAINNELCENSIILKKAPHYNKLCKMTSMETASRIFFTNTYDQNMELFNMIVSHHKDLLEKFHIETSLKTGIPHSELISQLNLSCGQDLPTFLTYIYSIIHLHENNITTSKFFDKKFVTSMKDVSNKQVFTAAAILAAVLSVV